MPSVCQAAAGPKERHTHAEHPGLLFPFRQQRRRFRLLQRDAAHGYRLAASIPYSLRSPGQDGGTMTARSTPDSGTLCNITCRNCYIESSPKNDRLVYLGVNDIRPYLDEISRDGLGTEEIGFTGGEPLSGFDDDAERVAVTRIVVGQRPGVRLSPSSGQSGRRQSEIRRHPVDRFYLFSVFR